MANRTILPIMATALFLVGSHDAHALEGKFRGMYVCSKLPATRDMLRAPADVVVHGNTVQLARPLFNLNGTRVVGTELAAGTLEGDGTLHLTSDWSFQGNLAKGNYSGKLTPEGGTLTGNQTWTGPDGSSALNRPCAVAFVPAPEPPSAPDADGGAESMEDEP